MLDGWGARRRWAVGQAHHRERPRRSEDDPTQLPILVCSNYDCPYFGIAELVSRWAGASGLERTLHEIPREESASRVSAHSSDAIGSSWFRLLACWDQWEISLQHLDRSTIEAKRFESSELSLYEDCGLAAFDLCLQDERPIIRSLRSCMKIFNFEN